MFWLKLFEYKLDISYSEYGIYPRTYSGIKGIFFHQFIHGDWEHLIYNSVPFFLGSLSLFVFYPKSASKVLFLSYLLPGILVWIFARQTYHIGLSGVNYSIIAFLLFSGLIRRDAKSLVVSMIIILFYSSMIVGLFPVQKGVSFESHIAGFLIGIVLVFIFRKNDPIDKFDWESESSDLDHDNTVEKL